MASVQIHQGGANNFQGGGGRHFPLKEILNTATRVGEENSQGRFVET